MDAEDTEAKEEHLPVLRLHMSRVTKTLSDKQKETIRHQAVDRVWMATRRTFLIDFEMGGSLTVRIGLDGNLEYKLEE